MTQDMEIETPPIPSKEEISEKVIDICVETLFVERNEISKDTDVIKDFKIYHHDVTYFFTMVFKHFNVPVYAKGDFPPTIEGISEFIYDYLASERHDEDPRDKKGILGRFLQWLKPY
jgi:hypothetical protein